MTIHQPASARTGLTTDLWAAGLLCGLVLIIYLPAMSAGYIWDDDQYVTDNLVLRTMDGLAQIWFEPRATPQYYPAVFSTFWLEYQIWGLHPTGFHVVNIILHALNALLLYRALVLLDIRGAFFAAVLFAAAPLHVESVAWVSERKNVLSGLFYLAAFLSYWRFANLSGEGESIPAARRWWFYGASLLLFALGLLSKSVTCSLPAVILLVLWWKLPDRLSRHVPLLVPMFALGIAAGLHTMLLEKHHVGAQGLDWDWSLTERCLIAGRAVCFYAGKLVWPHPLIFIYPKWQIDASAWWQYLFGATVAAVAAGLWLARRHIGRGPLVGVLYFVGTLFPALGFIDVYPMRFSFVADHFAYLASIGVISLLAAGSATVVTKFRVPRPWMLLSGTVVVVLFGGVTLLRCFDYQDRETLWVATLADNPNCWMASFNLAAIRVDQGRPAEAAQLFQNALSQQKHNQPGHDEQADLHHYLGDTLVMLGQPSDAEAHFRKSAEYYQSLAELESPPTTEPHNNLGILYGKLQDFDESLRHFRRALEIDPLDPHVNRNLGELYYRQQQFAESALCFQRVLDVDPGNAQAHYNLGTVALTQGHREKALRHLREALRIDPGFRQADLVLRQALAK